MKMRRRQPGTFFAGSHLPKKCVICFIENPLKIMKNAFYFILKALFFSRYLSFCHDILVMLEKRLD